MPLLVFVAPPAFALFVIIDNSHAYLGVADLMPKLAIERAVVGRQVDLDFVAALLHSVVMLQSLHEDDVVNRAHVLDRLIVFEISVVVVGVHPNVVDNHVGKFEEHEHHIAINGAGIVVTETTKSLKRKLVSSGEFFSNLWVGIA